MRGLSREYKLLTTGIFVHLKPLSPNLPHSLLKLFTGLANAAFTD